MIASILVISSPSRSSTSSYGNGYYGVEYPDTQPYKIVYNAMLDSNKSLAGIPEGSRRAVVRPWSGSAGVQTRSPPRPPSSAPRACRQQPHSTAAMLDSNKSLAGIPEGSRRAVVRPWLQDFTASYLKHYIRYGKEEVPCPTLRWSGALRITPPNTSADT